VTERRPYARTAQTFSRKKYVLDDLTFPGGKVHNTAKDDMTFVDKLYFKAFSRK
jgi:hypothetical protein